MEAFWRNSDACRKIPKNSVSPYALHVSIDSAITAYIFVFSHPNSEVHKKLEELSPPASELWC